MKRYFIFVVIWFNPSLLNRDEAIIYSYHLLFAEAKAFIKKQRSDTKYIKISEIGTIEVSEQDYFYIKHCGLQISSAWKDIKPVTI